MALRAQAQLPCLEAETSITLEHGETPSQHEQPTENTPSHPVGSGAFGSTPPAAAVAVTAAATAAGSDPWVGRQGDPSVILKHDAGEGGG